MRSKRNTQPSAMSREREAVSPKEVPQATSKSSKWNPAEEGLVSSSAAEL